MADPATARVLSIQSSVVHGHVGNRAAVFPLELLGLEVDAIHSVQFSNHTGYPGGWTGRRLAAEELEELVRGMEINGLVEGIQYLLTGYMASAEFLVGVGKLLQKLKEKNHELAFICDPVMGDGGKLYVQKEMIQVYRQYIVPHALVLMPNQTEIELLTDMKISSLQDAVRATQIIHDMGVEYVVITSMDIDISGEREQLERVLVSTTENELLSNSNAVDNPIIVFMSKKTKSESEIEHYITFVERIPGYYSGTGDLVSSLFLAWFHKTNRNFPLAVKNAMESCNAVLRRTFENKKAELMLVQSKKELETPPAENPLMFFKLRYLS